MPLPITLQDFIDHYDRSMALLDAASETNSPSDKIAEAQVHATLAQVAAYWIRQPEK